MDTDVRTPAEEAVESLTTELTKALEVLSGEFFRCVDTEVVHVVRATARVVAMAKALHFKAVAELDQRGYAAAAGDINTPTWTASSLNQTHKAAKIDAKLATALAGPHRQLGESVERGEVNDEQALAIVDSLNRVAKHATAAQMDFARTLMLEYARDHNAEDLRVLGKGILDRADTDGPKPDDDDHPEKLRGLTYHDHHDGTQSLKYRDTVENLAKVKAAIGSLDAPKDAKDERSTPVRRADAMVELFEKFLRTGDLPTSRGVAPHIDLVVGLDTLKGISGAAYGALATGSAISPEAVRRLFCDAEVTPIVLDAKGKPLSVGRTSRNWTPAQWKALVARDGGCVHPGCTAPPWLCRGHHLKYWTEHFGPTDVENGALLCEKHHQGVHHHGWECRLGEDGLPEMIPPAHIDTEQKPRRNFYWQMQRGLLLPPDLGGLN